ncbi:AbrB/MazE/SpoVT family DNA-binding domain-containing protein [Fuchsiella alkaliacetigena]|uniref:AbrB/MazE/SpoVT family DNA-binding domain-containing protein n=1 Tax=Fuchsiella alkaliacetigena TaxID=957042 RepID=UPI00200B3110|nr:AbrB/MazE/SpoVT family DNA-binding domain-containing protein [Fuchsiella alkaliacetigena]MCK8825937.1 AbrB/MazE/SpoVT family DNA-binding domain-containing protein [Fuchsiella alkaliacetigena]
MKSIGIVRKIDNLGRVTIPKEVRDNLGIEKGTPLGIYIDGEKLIFKKYEPQCTFCSSEKDIVNFKDKIVCSECLSEIEEEVS